jgi:hypothetical protein
LKRLIVSRHSDGKSDSRTDNLKRVSVTSELVQCYVTVWLDSLTCSWEGTPPATC